MADDVTQATFILLARKASAIDANVVVAAWLHKATRYAALNAMKIETRRRAHERRAGDQRSRERRPITPNGANVDINWAQGAALLDVGVARLGDRDREAVVLRFLERRSFAEVGHALGVTEEAAQMRVGRAVEKLRGFFRRHGLVVTTATLRATVNANAIVAAPTSLKLALIATRAATTHGGATKTAATLADAAGHAMDAAAIRTMSTFAAAGLAAAILAAILFLHVRDADLAGKPAPAAAGRSTRAVAEVVRPQPARKRDASTPPDWLRAPLAAIAARVDEICTPRPLVGPVETAQLDAPRR